MAKSMAVITEGVVSNVIWCSDYTPETETRKDPGDRPVGIGDTYAEGRFYREGVMLLTPMEELQRQITELDNAYTEGVNSI